MADPRPTPLFIRRTSHDQEAAVSTKAERVDLHPAGIDDQCLDAPELGREIDRPVVASAIAMQRERVFGTLTRDRDNEYLMIDSAIVRAHAQAATGQKGGSKTRL